MGSETTREAWTQAGQHPLTRVPFTIFQYAEKQNNSSWGKQWNQRRRAWNKYRNWGWRERERKEGIQKVWSDLNKDIFFCGTMWQIMPWDQVIDSSPRCMDSSQSAITQDRSKQSNKRVASSEQFAWNLRQQSRAREQGWGWWGGRGTYREAVLAGDKQLARNPTLQNGTLIWFCYCYLLIISSFLLFGSLVPTTHSCPHITWRPSVCFPSSTSLWHCECVFNFRSGGGEIKFGRDITRFVLLGPLQTLETISLNCEIVQGQLYALYVFLLCALRFLS